MSPLAQLIAAGVDVEPLPDGKLRATGILTDDIDALIRAHKPDILAELTAMGPATHYAWWLAGPGGRAFEVRITPEQTQAEVEARYPGATVKPLPKTVH